MNLFLPMSPGSGYGMWGLHTFEGVRKALARQGNLLHEKVSVYTDHADNSGYSKWLAKHRKFHDTSLALHSASQRHTVGGREVSMFPMHETTKVPASDVDALKSCEKVLVASEYLKGVFEQAGISSEVIEAGLDLRLYDPIFIKKQKEKRDPQKPMTFLMLGKYEKRKATREMIEAFLRVFEDHPLRDQVVLKLKILSPVYSRPLGEIKRDLQDLFLLYPRAATRIVTVDRPQMDVLALLEDADCLLMPSRAEGIGLGVLEAAASGVFVICTPYTAFSTYADPESMILLPDRGQEDASDPFYGIRAATHGSWGRVELRDLEEALLRFLELTPDERKEKTRAARFFLENRFDTNDTAERLLSTIGVINGNLGTTNRPHRDETEQYRTDLVGNLGEDDGCCIQANRESCPCAE